jgi:hypothetical protein
MCGLLSVACTDTLMIRGEQAVKRLFFVGTDGGLQDHLPARVEDTNLSRFPAAGHLDQPDDDADTVFGLFYRRDCCVGGLDRMAVAVRAMVQAAVVMPRHERIVLQRGRLVAYGVVPARRAPRRAYKYSVVLSLSGVYSPFTPATGGRR